MAALKFWRRILLSATVVLSLSTTSCTKLYNPPATSTSASHLVVEGNISSGSDSTFIKLSRTVNLSGKISASPELAAILSVESDQNSSFPLKEVGDGIYACGALNLDIARKYRLNIKTSAGQRYASDYVAVLNSPAIDSISFDTKGSPQGPGLNIYANTHDPSGKMRYFRWDYAETWIIHPAFASYYKSNGDTVLLRNMTTDNINTCWQSDTASTIVLASSTQLTQSVISGNTIITIPSDKEKLGDEYSIIVRQYALSAGAYTFYSNLKKNTEQLGGIFTALPSQIPGNIHNTSDLTEPVLGYITVGSTVSQRIFIHKSQLPFAWTFPPFEADCKLLDDIARRKSCCYYALPYAGTIVNQVDEYINYLKSANPDPFIPILAIQMPGHPPLGYTAASRKCSDCTLRGTNKKPAYWQ